MEFTAELKTLIALGILGVIGWGYSTRYNREPATWGTDTAEVLQCKEPLGKQLEYLDSLSPDCAGFLDAPMGFKKCEAREDLQEAKVILHNRMIEYSHAPSK